MSQSSATSSAARNSWGGLRITEFIAIGVVIPNIVCVLILFHKVYICIWERKRRGQRERHANVSEHPSGNPQLDIQQEAKLDVELEAGKQRYELSGEDSIQEIPGDRDISVVPPPGTTRELRGEEHSKELTSEG